MICLEILINGSPLCTAGLGVPGSVKAFIAWILRHSQEDLSGTPGTSDESLGIEVSGNIWQPEELVRWPHAQLKVGDEITIRLVERQSADEPIDRRRVDAAATHNFLRGQYKRLKQLFENEEL
jgi:hypothetical protein